MTDNEDIDNTINNSKENYDPKKIQRTINFKNNKTTKNKIN